MAHGPGPERIMRRPNIWAPFFHASTGEDGAYGQVESYEALATFLNHKLADYNQGQTCACPGGGCPTLLMMNSILMIQYCNSNSMCSNIRDGAKWSLHSTHCTPQPRTPPLSPPPHTPHHAPLPSRHTYPPHTLTLRLNGCNIVCVQKKFMCKILVIIFFPTCSAFRLVRGGGALPRPLWNKNIITSSFSVQRVDQVVFWPF